MMLRTCNELDTADGCSILFPEERPPKKEKGLKKTGKKASSGGNSSLSPASNNKEPAFTWITNLEARVCSLIEPKYKRKLLLILLGIFLSGANGKEDPDTTDWKLVPLLAISLVIAIFLVIAIKKNFPYMPRIRAWWEKPRVEKESQKNSPGLKEKEGQKDSPGLKEEESQKDSSGLKKEESRKDSSGWKVKSEEQDTSKTWITKFGGSGHMYKRMLLYFILFGTFSSGANGEVYLQREDFRKIIIATNETQIATDLILRRDDYLVYSVFAKDGNDDYEGYECTPDFVSTNQNCRIVAGDRSKAECEGLQISMNGSYTYLTVDGSKLTYDRTTFCILQRVPLPESSILYHVEVSKKQDQVDVQRKDFRSITMATSETKVATDPVPKPVNGANYLIFARDENDPGSYNCTPKFVAVNQSCNIFVGDKNKTECEGLQISGNGTHVHLAVDGSKLTHEHTAFCILQQFPGLHSLYPLGVFKKHDRAPDHTDTTNQTLVIVFVVAADLAILCVIFATLFYCQRSRSKSTKQVRNNDVKMERLQSLHDTDTMGNGHAA